MKKIVFAVSLFAAFVMIACTPETLNEQLGIPDDAILLSSERFSGHGDKTSVEDLSVKWVTGDIVYLNGMGYSVTVDNGNAYVSASDAISVETYGYYGVSDSPSPSWNSLTKKLTVTVPSEYTSSFDGDRQVIALPMVAYKSGAANKIEFKHVTAAVKVRVKNTTNYILELDKVVVSSKTLQLCGTRDVTLNPCAVSDQSGDLSADDTIVTVNFEANTFVNPYSTDDDIKDVQVPILPVGSGSLTIQIYAHVAGTPAKANTYVYKHKASSVALDRNVMITANVNLGGSHTAASLNGLFTVASGKQVFFSKGNLQYQASTGIWRFAEQQYTAIGNAVGNNYFEEDRDKQSNWIDLFGWGTSGWNNGNSNYMPYINYYTSSSYAYGYGPKVGNVYNYDLTGDYAESDWGWHNQISNGGNANHTWRTMTGGSGKEFDYLLNTRTASTVNGTADARFTKGKVNNVYGMILFPDSYVHPGDVTSPVGINSTSSGGWYGNNYNLASWEKMEAAGAVFLPVTGRTESATVASTGYGYYWSASYNTSSNTKAYQLYFASGQAAPYNSIYRYYGCAVRLVQEK